MICDNCGGKNVKVRRVTRSFGQGESAFLIEDVPVIQCRDCHESYLTAATLEEIERIRSHWRELCEIREVPVAKFDGAA